MENGIDSKENAFSSADTLSSIKSDRKKDEESAKKTESNAKEKHLTGFFKNSFKTLSMPKKTLPEKDKNEPSRFLGEGVTFKAKLIGILEVEEARGDRMCQEALYELKMAVRAAGEHKQRINIVIAIDGIRLRDEKTGDCLHHHPVHKISFIAQDVADSRAFGYIFGSPDTSHRFFGIKTDKAASQVVMAMRDLFQAVYELKKREVEMAKQNIEQHQQKYGSSIFLDSVSSSSSKISLYDQIARPKQIAREESNKNTKNKTQTVSVIADLMDLELELNSLQQGLSQMERLTPSDPFGPSPSIAKEDPFGDSFTPPPCITTPPPAKLPPPPNSGDRRKVGGSTSSAASQPELHWFDKETQDLFGGEKNSTVAKDGKEDSGPQSIESKSITSSKDLYDIFVELDPLGTGRSKPYTDKKDFFQELKNPPKKQLKDLRSVDGVSAPSKSLLTEDSSTERTYEDHLRKYRSVDSDQRITLAEELSRRKDPNDPFETSFANFTSFEGTRNKSALPRRSPHSQGCQNSPDQSAFHLGSSALRSSSNSTKSVYKSLTSGDDVDSPSANDQFTRKSSPQWRRLHEDPSKQKIIIDLRKVLQNVDDTDKENDSPVAEEATVLRNPEIMSPGAGGDISSDSFESIPEPPPRPITSPMVSHPPPLPPKKLQLPVTMKPPPPQPSNGSSSHYDYIENYESVGYRQPLRNGDVHIPPLPAPARKPKFNHHEYDQRETVRHRPQKQHSVSGNTSSAESDYYLTPISKKQEAKQSKRSLNITISQLTSTGFDDLAAILRIPASALSKMTLKELTECLSRLTEAECQKLENDMNSRNRGTVAAVDDEARRKYFSLKESFEEDSIFKANFDEKFPPKSNPSTCPSSAPPQVDKYAVFRELIDQEQQSSPFADVISERPEANDQPLSPDKDADVEPVQKDSLTDTATEKNEDTAAECQIQEASSANSSPTSVPPEEATPNDVKINETVDTPQEIPSERDTEKRSDIEEQTKEIEVSPVPEIEVGKNWAKFDIEQDSKETTELNPPSPWREERKEGGRRASPIKYKKRASSRPRWNDYDNEDEDEEDDYEEDDDEEEMEAEEGENEFEDDVNDDDYGDDSEENWESSKKSLASSWDESSWRENGWSDRDSLYDEGEVPPAMARYREQQYQLKKRGYQRKYSPHKKSASQSPWEEESSGWPVARRNPATPYREYLDEAHKTRTPPRKPRYDAKEEDELTLLKMMLGKKRLQALEAQLFKHYHDQLNEKAAAATMSKRHSKMKGSSSSLLFDRSYDELGSGNTGRRAAKKYYQTQTRPKSADKGRKPLIVQPEDTEELYVSNKNRYRRPCSHDELSISEEERWTSTAFRKPSSVARSRHHSQNSPFEDNFAPADSEPADTSKVTSAAAVTTATTTTTTPSIKTKHQLSQSKYSSSKSHAYASCDNLKYSRTSRDSSQRQSPFEDDFAPPETARNHSMATNDSKECGNGSRRKPADDTFFGNGVTSPSSTTGTSKRRSCGRHEAGQGRRTSSETSHSCSKYYENVELWKKTSPSESRYSKHAALKESSGAELAVASPKKSKSRRHDPFNDNIQGYESRTVPRLGQKTKSKSKMSNYDSGSDSTEAGAGGKWKEDGNSFAFGDQHNRK